jgi:hypothetical protein
LKWKKSKVKNIYFLCPQFVILLSAKIIQSTFFSYFFTKKFEKTLWEESQGAVWKKRGH